MKKHRILSLLLAAIMLIPANVTALAYDRTSKEPPSSTERVEQLRNSGLESLESADPIDPLEEITASSPWRHSRWWRRAALAAARSGTGP